MINETEYTNIPLTKEQENQIDALFAQYDNTDTPGCAVGVIQDGRFIYKKSFGMANLDYDIPITADSKFDIASVTKQFTAACIMLLHTDGKLNLNEDIRKYLPDLPEYGNVITIHNLLNHTGGLNCYLQVLAENNSYFSGNRYVNHHNNHALYETVCKQTMPDFCVGEKFSYSTTGYLLLAEIISKIAGISFSQFAKIKIFEPLKMMNTLIDDNYQQIIKNRVVSYLKTPEEQFLRYNHSSDDVGSKGVVTNLNDLLIWNNYFYKGKLFDINLVNIMTNKSHLSNGSLVDYGYGFEIYDNNNQHIYGHGGKWLGFRSQMMRFDHYDITIIVLANRTDITATAKAKEVANALKLY